MAQAHPDIVTLKTIGKTHENREMYTWSRFPTHKLTATSPKTPLSLMEVL
jgi:hypothetical protein